jgi:hypothetical protein
MEKHLLRDLLQRLGGNARLGSNIHCQRQCDSLDVDDFHPSPKQNFADIPRRGFAFGTGDCYRANGDMVRESVH